MTVGLHHVDAALDEDMAPRGIAREGTPLVALSRAMAFDVRLADEQEPVLVAEPVPVGVVGIVAGPHRVEPIFFYESDIALHLLMRDRIAAAGGHLVPVDPPDNEPLAIHVNNRI